MQQGKNDSNNQKTGLSWSTPGAQQQKPNLPINNTPKQEPTQPLALSTQPTQSHAAKFAGMFAAGIIAGVLIAWGWSSVTGGPTEEGVVSTATSTSQSASASNNSGASTATNTSAISGSVSVDSSGSVVPGTATATSVVANQPAGPTVAVSNIQVSKPTWVVVYEEANGQRGNALGAKLFFASPTAQNGSITLLRATERGRTYLVGQSVDNGNRKFELHTDEAVVGANGQPVMTQFTAQ